MLHRKGEKDVRREGYNQMEQGHMLDALDNELVWRVLVRLEAKFLNRGAELRVQDVVEGVDHIKGQRVGDHEARCEHHPFVGRAEESLNRVPPGLLAHIQIPKCIQVLHSRYLFFFKCEKYADDNIPSFLAQFGYVVFFVLV